MVAPGNVIQLKDLVPGITRIIPKKEDNNRGFLSGLLSVLGIGLSIAIPFLAPEGLAFTIAAETIAAGVDLGLQAVAAKVEERQFGLGDAIFSLVGSGAAAVSAISAAKVLRRSKNVVEEITEQAARKGYSSLQFDVITEQAQKAIINKQGAKVVSQQLLRAGFTEKQAIQELEYLSSVFKRNGINIGRFDNEISFIKQETFIFQELGNVTQKFGIDINDVVQVLEQSGLDVVGIQNTTQLARNIRRNGNAIKQLKNNKLFNQLEGALERDLEPTLFTRVLNAKNAERGITKVNKILSLSNPNSFITEVTNKIFDPIKNKIDKKLLTPFKKKTKQKLKLLIRQDLVRKQETKNGVYPCFGSSWINYIRAVPLSKGIYKARVIMRKWGYKPVTITPDLKLQDIINWSESSSPGRIYHKFREQFGQDKGKFSNNGDSASFNANTSSIFNLLGFIPNKYISLGVSLVGNIATARSVIALDSWGDFFKNTDNLFKPLQDKGLEIVGGQFAKAGRDQLLGNKKAMQSYFQGKVTESLESRESDYRKSTKEGRGRIDSIKSLKNTIK